MGFDTTYLDTTFLDTTSFALFLVAACVIAITPGPAIFYVAARTLAGGRAEGLASSVGTGLGGLVHVAAGALGVSALVMASAEAFPGTRASIDSQALGRASLPRAALHNQ